MEGSVTTTSKPMMHNMRLAYSSDGTAVYRPVINAGAGNGQGSAGGNGVASAGINVNVGGGGEQVRKKRGRPRKYGTDAGTGLGVVPPQQAGSVTQSTGGGFTPSPPTVGSGVTPSGSVSSNSAKKPRGRPPGSGKKQQTEAMASVGFGFSPHLITVKAGEDVSAKIMELSEDGPRAVCVLSASGAVSNVTLRQPAISGGTVSFEGGFEILSLSGSFVLTENGGQRGRAGNLTVSLSGPDGRVVGGIVAGLLMASSPVQVVVASFIVEGQRSKSTKQKEVTDPQTGESTGPSSPPSRGTLSESSGGPASPPSLGAGGYNNHTPGISAVPWK